METPVARTGTATARCMLMTVAVESPGLGCALRQYGDLGIRNRELMGIALRSRGAASKPLPAQIEGRRDQLCDADWGAAWPASSDQRGSRGMQPASRRRHGSRAAWLASCWRRGSRGSATLRWSRRALQLPLHQVSQATNRVSSVEWVNLLAIVLTLLIPLRPLLPRHRRDPTYPTAFSRPPASPFSSSVLGSVTGELQAYSDLGMAARVGGEEWKRFGSSSREGTAFALSFSGAANLARAWDPPPFLLTSTFSNEGFGVRSFALAVHDRVLARIRRRRTVAEALHGHKWIRDINGAMGIQTILDYLNLWSLVQSVDQLSNQPDSIIWKWESSDQPTNHCFLVEYLSIHADMEITCATSRPLLYMVNGQLITCAIVDCHTQIVVSSMINTTRASIICWSHVRNPYNSDGGHSEQLGSHIPSLALQQLEENGGCYRIYIFLNVKLHLWLNRSIIFICRVLLIWSPTKNLLVANKIWH
uniref:Uncharacterized protein n=1 Tax=Oryza meridionalis TaxID=40149 RepID=A0A0E0C7S0_9ORYZ